MHHTDTVRIATNPRKWRRPAPCPACRKSRPLILTLGTIYNLPNPQTGQHHLRLHLPQLSAQMHPPRRRQNPKKAIRLWNHHASHQRNEQ